MLRCSYWNLQEGSVWGARSSTSLLIGELAILLEDEEHTLLVEWNDTA